VFKEKQVTHTNTRHEQHHKRPHEEPHPSLNSDRRWRGDGAFHLPHPGGWPRPTVSDYRFNEQGPEWGGYFIVAIELVVL